MDQPGSRLKSMVEQLGMDVDAKRTKVVNLSQSGDPASAGAMAGDEGRRGGRNAKKVRFSFLLFAILAVCFLM